MPNSRISNTPPILGRAAGLPDVSRYLVALGKLFASSWPTFRTTGIRLMPLVVKKPKHAAYIYDHICTYDTYVLHIYIYIYLHKFMCIQVHIHIHLACIQQYVHLSMLIAHAYSRR